MKKTGKHLAALLCLVLLFTHAVFPAVGSAPEVTDTTADSSAPLDTAVPAPSAASPVLRPYTPGPGELTTYELAAMEVDLSALPEVIDPAAALEKGHVNRLEEQEQSLYTVLYQNTDGTKTTYLFDRPVKYIDANGAARDKSSAVTVIDHPQFSHAMLDNSVKVYFSDTETGHTLVRYGGYSLSMKPVTDAVTPPLVSDNTVAYKNAFGNGTLLVYQTRLNGVKEDIVLLRSIGRSSFSFELTLIDLTPVQTEVGWSFHNAEGRRVASFGEIAIRDSAGQTTLGSLSVTPAAETDRYTVTVSAPEEFLNADTTVYPVYIDPTTTIFDSGSTTIQDENYEYIYIDYDAIVDTGLYYTEEVRAAAAANPYYHTLSGDGRIIYKLYDFYGEYGMFKDLPPARFGSATLNIRMGAGSATTLSAYPMTTKLETDSATVCNSALWNGYTDEDRSDYFSVGTNASVCEVDITEIVRGWLRYNANQSTLPHHNPQNGFMLQSSLSDSSRTVTATEDLATADASVTVVLDTSPFGGEYYLNNVALSKYLWYYSSANTFYFTLTSNFGNPASMIWIIEYLGNSHYYIRLASESEKCLTASGSTVSVSVLPDTSNEAFLWNVKNAVGGGVILKHMQSGSVLTYIPNDNDGTPSMGTELASSHADYAKTAWGIIVVSNYVQLQGISVNHINWFDIGQSHYPSLVPTPANATYSAAEFFKWSSDNESIATVEADGKITAHAIGTAKITLTSKSARDVSYSFLITVGQIVPNGTYRLMNKQTGKFLDVEGPSTESNANLQQWDWHTGDQMKWDISYAGSGYYRIHSVYSQKYMSVYGNSASDTSRIIQTDYNSTASGQLWRIVKTPSDTYKFTPKSGTETGICLGLVDNCEDNGANCITRIYASDTNFIDDWYLMNLDYTINLEVWVDQGYISQYSNFEAASLHITQHLWKLREFYAENFHIGIIYSAPISFVSYADECNNRNSDGTCNHCTVEQCDNASMGTVESEIGYHHNNLNNIMAHIFAQSSYPSEFQSSCLAFIGHKICVEGHEYSFNGLTDPYHGLATVVKHSGSTNNELGTIIHEIGHLFGAIDHYGGRYSTTDIANQEAGYEKYLKMCSFGEYHINKTICSGCRSDIQANASRQNVRNGGTP